MSTIAIIPARKGSKGIPNKNMRNFLGKPLIRWTIDQAVDSNIFDEIVVASDSHEILELAGDLRVSRYLRSAKSASDTAPTEEVIDEVLTWMENSSALPDTVVLLQPTSPNRELEDISNASWLYQNGSHDSLFSAVRFDRFLWWQRGPEGDHHIDPLNYTLRYKRPRRQDIEYPQWLENGSIYIFDVAKYLETDPRNRLFGNIGVYEMPAWSQFELDTEEDWEIMEMMMERQLWPTM